MRVWGNWIAADHTSTMHAQTLSPSSWAYISVLCHTGYELKQTALRLHPALAHETNARAGQMSGDMSAFVNLDPTDRIAATACRG